MERRLDLRERKKEENKRTDETKVEKQIDK